MSSGSQYIRGKGGATPVMDGDAAIGDVLSGKTFYNTDPNTKLTGTAVFATGDFTIYTSIPTEIELEKSWDIELMATDHTITLDKSWNIT